jgi:hypothetical protein
VVRRWTHPRSARFELYWPEPERDRALVECTKHLEQYGERYEYDRTAVYEDIFGQARPTAIFSPLDRPATEEDLREGNAIFALSGERRLVPLPGRPLKALWISYQDAPYAATTYKDGRNETTVHYQKECAVWQAEEVLRDGVWERWFGVVAPHGFARVPAAELEMLPDRYPYSWTKLGTGLSLRLCDGGDRAAVEGITILPEIGPGTPLEFRVELFNSTGTARSLPNRALHFAIVAEHAQGQIAERESSMARAPDNTRWNSLPLAEFTTPGLPTNEMELGATVEIFRFDLRKIAEIVAPNWYRVKLRFDDPEIGRGETPWLGWQVTESASPGRNPFTRP